jgi:RNA polymerase sigma-B factor
VEAKLTLAPVFRRLPDRDRHVLRLRFIDDLTQREIGGIVGVSQVHVSRILARILRLAQDELAR